MATISTADNFGLPVSTTHVLSSGVAELWRPTRGSAGSNLAQHCYGLIFTLPVAALPSGSLYFLFRQISN